MSPTALAPVADISERSRVYRIEYVDANGEAQVIGHTDKESLTAASGCLA